MTKQFVPGVALTRLSPSLPRSSATLARSAGSRALTVELASPATRDAVRLPSSLVEAHLRRF